MVQKNYYVFKVLPIGLSTACYLFTKLMRPLVRYWRGRGLKAIVYLDDGIVAVKREEKAKVESSKVEQDLGLLLVWKKVFGSHRIVWNGLDSILI